MLRKSKKSKKYKKSDFWIINYWNEHKFKILVCVSIIVILILCSFNGSRDGTWSFHYEHIPEMLTNPDTYFKKRKYPQKSKGEIECRKILERIFDKPFPTIRPDFLMNDITGKPLEIDCCNMELKIGVEYNGRQHYQYTPGMHKNYESFRLQQYRDNMKIEKCKENDFILIIVPYTIDIENIENYLIEELRIRGYTF